MAGARMVLWEGPGGGCGRGQDGAMAGARMVLWQGPGWCCGRGLEGAVAGARRRLWSIVERRGKPLRVRREDGGCITVPLF